MADITITIPDAKLTLLLGAIANRYGWDPAGGLTKAQFAKRVTFDWWKSVVRTDLANTQRVGFIPEDFPATTLEVLIEPSPIQEERCKHERSI